MASYTINKGVGKSWEFKGISPFFSLLGIGLLVILAILFFLLFFCFDIWLAAGTCCPVALVVLYRIRKLNKQFGQDGVYRWLAKRKRPQAIRNNGDLYKKLFKN